MKPSIVVPLFLIAALVWGMFLLKAFVVAAPAPVMGFLFVLKRKPAARKREGEGEREREQETVGV